MDFAILGLPYDKTQTLRKGAADAPEELRKVFPKLETFIFGIDLTEKAFFKDLGDIHAADIKAMDKAIFEKLDDAEGKFPILLGGEHTVTAAAVKAIKPEKVVIFDAHADCENSETHTGVTRKVAEIIGAENVYLFGVRVASKEEDKYLREHKIKVLKNIEELRRLQGKIYLSVDFDVLDPSELASVGNPEPMGHSFAEIAEAINILAPKLIAVDFVEFTPNKADISELHALIAGKMIYGAVAALVKSREVQK